ncbi:MAG: hypothetical protein JNL67_19660 [Planctomycetaceae bacterium]|nr:hypothetical protein [Planctomycetaceae bacterium]
MTFSSSTATGAVAASKLLKLILELDPQLSTEDVFRVGYLLTMHADLQRLDQPEYIQDVWLELTLRLQAAADQQAAVSEELDSLASTDPQKFTPHQVWLLIKAIKVLSQTLEFYSK